MKEYRFEAKASNRHDSITLSAWCVSSDEADSVFASKIDAMNHRFLSSDEYYRLSPAKRVGDKVRVFETDSIIDVMVS